MPARRKPVKFAMVLTMLVCLGGPSSAQKKHIRVAAASDLETVLPQVARAYEDEARVGVDLTYGSSGNFFAQIRNGAPFDLFFSADQEFPAKLIQDNLAEPRSAVVYGIGSLILWLPPTANCDPQAEKWNCILKPAVAKVAIANPAHAPYGRAAVAALQAAHIYDQLRTRLVLGENISQAAQFVQSGNAQAGILASTQASSPAMRDGKQWEIPRDSYPPIEQTVVILKAGKEKSAAEDFLKFVTSAPGRKLLKQYGLQPPMAPASPTERHR